MAKRKLSERQEMQKQAEREMSVYKRDDMIQKSRHQLSVQEQRCVLYAISKIKPTDEVFQEYTFDIKDFYILCGIQKESYTELKAILKGLADRSWWAVIDDKGTESLLRWFSTVRTNKKSGKVTIEFHKDMMPFLLHLTGKDGFYTGYSLQYVLPMSGQYSPRLYELLKSYQKNNKKWFFPIDELKRLLGAQNYKDFYDFKRFVLEPAIKEVNKFTDIQVAYNTHKEGRKVTRVHFFMDGKTDRELAQAHSDIQEALDGQIDLFSVLQEMEEDPGVQFEQERQAIHKAEEEAKKAGKRQIAAWLDPEGTE